MKKIFALVLIMVMVFVAVPVFASVNPFIDLPQNHWAVSSVEYLNARGLVVGYPDGAFKGSQPSTRFEVASVVARILKEVDLTKASKSDFEILKKLVAEFKEELDALGVKHDLLDTRVGILEENLGGWKISGKMVFLFNHTGNDNSIYQLDRSESFRFDTAELYFSKKIDEKVSFYGVLASNFEENGDFDGVFWKNFYIDIKLPYNFNMRAGRFNFDWGNYVDDKPWFGDVNKTGFMFDKTFNANLSTAFYVNKELEGYRHADDLMVPNSDVFSYGAKFNADFERFGLGMQYHAWDFKSVNGLGVDDNIIAYNFNGYFKFVNNVKVFGEYWIQDLEGYWINGNNDSPNAMRAGVFVPQDVFKFTDMWVEYNKWDAGFVLQNDPFGKFDTDIVFAVNRLNGGFVADTEAWFGKLSQRWSEKWETDVRYVKVTSDLVLEQCITNYSVGITHYYTPALSFKLSYDNVQFDNIARNDEDLIRFETRIVF